MKAFMDKDFLLETETAKKLFHDYAEKTPILDYHCHINPKEIAEDRQFDNITQVWLGGDHYKWRFMRSCGVDEKYITGDASDYEKFCKWAECLGKAIGNPLFHWSHLELQRYFGYNGVLNKNTADEVWNLCNEKLQQPSMSVRNLIKQSNVTLICTTDDPIDSLEWHKKLAADDTFDVKVLPAWRPDKAMNIEKPDYLDYLEKLAAAAGIHRFAQIGQTQGRSAERQIGRIDGKHLAQPGKLGGYIGRGNGVAIALFEHQHKSFAPMRNRPGFKQHPHPRNRGDALRRDAQVLLLPNAQGSGLQIG